jgi:hypothetical protein
MQELLQGIEADVLACAKILIAAMTEKKTRDIDELSKSIGIKIGQLYEGRYSPCSIRKQMKTGT